MLTGRYRKATVLTGRYRKVCCAYRKVLAHSKDINPVEGRGVAPQPTLIPCTWGGRGGRGGRARGSELRLVEGQHVCACAHV